MDGRELVLTGAAAHSLELLGHDDLGWKNVASGLAVAAEGIDPAEPLFPRVDLPAAAA